MTNSFASLSIQTPPPPTSQIRPQQVVRKKSNSDRASSPLPPPPSSSSISHRSSPLDKSAPPLSPGFEKVKGKGKEEFLLDEATPLSEGEDQQTLSNGKPRFVGDLERIKKDLDEPILKETGKRFVLFPIQYHEVSPSHSLFLFLKATNIDEGVLLSVFADLAEL